VGNLLSIAAIARLSPGRNGRPANAATVTRWIQRGILSRTGERIRLWAVRSGRSWVVAPKWLDEFRERLTVDRLGETGVATAALYRSPNAQRRATEVALWHLDAVLNPPIDRHPQADPVTGDGLIEVTAEPERVDDGAVYLDPSDVEEGGPA
jgi:hypothetical protein